MKSILLASATILGLTGAAFAGNPAAVHNPGPSVVHQESGNSTLGFFHNVDRMTTSAIPSKGYDEGNYQTPLENLPAGTRNAIYATGHR